MRPALIAGASAPGMLVPAIAPLVPANEDSASWPAFSEP
jgi:hypothetical protein